MSELFTIDELLLGTPSNREGALFSKWGRLLEISACFEASQLFPDCNSVEALRGDGFTERVIAVLQRNLADFALPVYPLDLLKTVVLFMTTIAAEYH